MPVLRTKLRLPRKAAQCIALSVVGIFATYSALAQKSDPLDPQSPSIPLSYKSAFEGYRSFRSDLPTPWRSVNETVRAVGGHTGSVRNVEIPEPEQAKPMQETQTAPEAPAPRAFPREPVQTESAPGHHEH